MAQLMLLPLTVSYYSKIQIVLPVWYRLTRVVPDKEPLNRCVCKTKSSAYSNNNNNTESMSHDQVTVQKELQMKAMLQASTAYHDQVTCETCSLAAIITDTQGHTWTQLVTRVLRIKFAANGFRTARTLYEILTGVTITKKVSRQSRHFNNLQQFTCKLSSL